MDQIKKNKVNAAKSDQIQGICFHLTIFFRAAETKIVNKNQTRKLQAISITNSKKTNWKEAIIHQQHLLTRIINAVNKNSLKIVI